MTGDGVISSEGKMSLASVWRHALVPGLPAFDAEDFSEQDLVFALEGGARAAKTPELHEHLRGLGGVAVAEVDDIVLATLQTLRPIRRPVAVFDPLGASGYLAEILPMKIQAEDGRASGPSGPCGQG